MKIREITNKAQDRWSYILQSLNIKVGNGKHCPCPVCGGKDRFRFDNKNGRGTYICNQCGSGDGLNLIKLFFNCDAKEASKIVSKCLLINQNHNDFIYKSTSTYETKELEILDYPICRKIEYLLSKAVLGKSNYLTQKGLNFEVPILNNKLFVPLVNIKGQYTGGQFIDHDGKKYLMKGSKKKGAFIVIKSKLNRPLDVKKILGSASNIVICEGLATGLSIWAFRPESIVISAIDAGNIIHVAKAVRDINQNVKIIIAGDNDIGNDKNVGKEKAIESAKMVNGFYTIPNTDFKADWDDLRKQFGIEKTKIIFEKNIISAKNNLQENMPNQARYNAEETNTIKLKSHSKNTEILLQSNTPPNIRADLFIQQFNGNLAFNNDTQTTHYYNGRFWEAYEDSKLIKNLMLMYDKWQINYTSNSLQSIIDLVRFKLEPLEEAKQNCIFFKNGVYSIKDKKFLDHDKSFFNTHENGIHYNIGEQVKLSLESSAPIFYKYLKNATKTEIKFNGSLAILYIILTNKIKWHYFIELTGEGGTGKSTFSEIARLLVGEHNVADCDLKELEISPSSRTQLINKKLIILSDQAQYIGNGDMLKKLSGQDVININPKYKKPFSYRPQSIVLAINNHSMVFKDNDSGIARRRIILVFNEVIRSEDRDPNLLDKLKQELPFIINYLLSFFTTDLLVKNCIENMRNLEEVEEIKRNNNPVYDFLRYLKTIDTADGLFIGQRVDIAKRFDPAEFLYHGFEVFYKSNIGDNLNMSVQSFVSQIKSILSSRGETYKTRILRGRTKTNLVYNGKLDELEWFKDYK